MDNKRLLRCALVMPFCPFILPPAAADLITAVSYDRQLKAGSGANLGPEFSGTSLPAIGTTQMPLPDGTSITGAYSFSGPSLIDNQVDFRIDTSYHVVAGDLVGEQGANFDLTPIEFTTTEPLAFAFAFSNTASDNATVVAAVIFSGPGVSVHDSGSSFIANGEVSIPLTSGLLAANSTYDLTVLAEASGPTDGHSLFDMVLTPLPEPNAIAIVLLGIGTRATARRRKSRSRNGIATD